MMTVVMPVWKAGHATRKGRRTVFRGLQYVHAIACSSQVRQAYRRTSTSRRTTFPAQEIQDPITNEDFVVLPVGRARQDGPAGPARAERRNAHRADAARPDIRAPQTPQPATGRSRRSAPGIGGSTGAGGTTAGISGVTSKSKDQSIRLYKGRSHYNEWIFVYTPQ